MPPNFLFDIHGLGHIPGLHDYRDRVLSLTVAESDLPDRVEQVDGAFPMYDQNGDNGCVGFALREAAQVALLVETKVKYELSPGFIWWNGRAALGWEGLNQGCVIRDAIKACNRLGIASHATCPYFPDSAAVKPSDRAFEIAKHHPLYDYETADEVAQVKTALVHRYAVVFGTALTESFNQAGRNRGLFPKPAGRLIGGHAMTYVAYDDNKQFDWAPPGGFKYRNHWTAKWGEDGWGWLPYAHHASAAVSDTWVLRGVRPR